MKAGDFFYLVLLYPTLVDCASHRALRRKQKNSHSIAFQECSGNSILPLIQDNPHFSKALGDTDQDTAEAIIDELCNDHHRSLQDQLEIPFSSVTARGRQFDKNYFDGGTNWNMGIDGTSKETSAGRIAAVASALSSHQLEWPSYIVNFDDTNSCQLRTAMCCFTKGQDPVTGVVSNIQDFTETSFQANADVCMVNLDKSPQAGHVKRGKTYYSDGRNTELETKDAYCTGFSWSENLDDVSTKYRANTLFHISMLNGFYNNNLVGGVPGAPMCACVEQMPVVSHANCVKPVQTRRLAVSKDDRLLIDASLDFVACDEESLVSEYGSDAANDREELSKIITGSCVDSVDNDLTQQSFQSGQSYKRGDAWWFADEDKWTPIVGKGFLYYPEMSSDDFKLAFDASSTKVIRRICKSCKPSHRDVYYKRITSVPDSLDLVETLKDSFTSENNLLGVDFTMYSKDKYGTTTTQWEFCNYSGTHGFPFECGPDEAVPQQWSSFTISSGTYAKDFAFYIEK